MKFFFCVDLDLNPHLPEIADVLGWKTMKRVAQSSGMSKIDIEEHECNHRNDVKEQTYALLEAWVPGTRLTWSLPNSHQYSSSHEGKKNSR